MKHISFNIDSFASVLKVKNNKTKEYTRAMNMFKMLYSVNNCFLLKLSWYCYRIYKEYLKVL